MDPRLALFLVCNSVRQTPSGKTYFGSGSGFISRVQILIRTALARPAYRIGARGASENDGELQPWNERIHTDTQRRTVSFKRPPSGPL